MRDNIEDVKHKVSFSDSVLNSHGKFVKSILLSGMWQYSVVSFPFCSCLEIPWKLVAVFRTPTIALCDSRVIQWIEEYRTGAELTSLTTLTYQMILSGQTIALVPITNNNQEQVVKEFWRAASKKEALFTGKS